MTIPIEILKTLADAAGHPLLKSVLHRQVETRVRPRPLKGMFEAELQTMQDKGLVMQKDNDLDADDPYFLLDEKGEAHAAKLRL